MASSQYTFPVPSPAPANAYSDPVLLYQSFKAPDYGADAHSRFRYQAVCAALYALSLLDESLEYSTVYCELLEDILLQHSDGTFVAIQVKTREKGLDPFKTSDPEMLAALGRFVDYEMEDGQRFRRYLVAVNCGFWHAERNWKNLDYIAHPPGNSLPESTLYSEQLIKAFNAVEHKRGSPVEESLAANVISKLCLQGTLPELGAERSKLQSELRRHVGNLTVDEMGHIVNDIEEFVCSLGSREHEDRVGVRSALADDPAVSRIQMILASKSITASGLRQRLKEAMVKARAVVLLYEKKECALIEEAQVQHPQGIVNALIKETSERMNVIHTLFGQLELRKASDNALDLQVWLNVNSTKLPDSLCIDAYLLIARIEAEMAGKQPSGAARDVHLLAARLCVEKAGAINAD